MKPLRIAIPIHSFEPGGVERVALNLAMQWQEAGHEVVVVLGRDEGLDRASAPRLLTYWRRACPIPTAAFETLWMVWTLFLYLGSNRADVIFCPGNTYTIVCVLMKLLHGDLCPPVVVKVSNDLIRADTPRIARLFYRLWLRINGLMLERFVGLADPMFDEIVTAMGVAPQRVATIHDPALSRDRFARLSAIDRSASPHRPRRFIAVGRLAPQKNFALLLHAFATGFRPGDTLTIVGGGPQRASLERVAARLALGHLVTFTGHVASPDAWLRDAECLVLSSDYEGVPAVVIEAIAAGLPVIATDCCASMASLLGDGSRGKLVPVGDASAFAAAIRDSGRLPALAAADRNYASRFVLEQAASGYLAVMRNAVIEAEALHPPRLAEPAR